MKKRTSKKGGARGRHLASEFGECYASSAREVIGKCRSLSYALRNSPTNREWQLNWEHAVIQLRKVGHVLSKVDGYRSKYIASAANTAFRNWNNDAGAKFSWFNWIDDERNLILKEDNSSVITTSQEEDEAFVEPKVLVNGQLQFGSQVVSDFIEIWIMEIEEIELEARSQKRNAKFAPS